ncbi:helix-turn-helix domain-containing protein [Paenibacillus sp. MER 99-2]|uniref:helix-turn-helix domain-containing protein n=1 Tax=Paenibacillus sp. MER 99-2 TaxID=2939572 RepID=UPI00203BF5CA|nr:helix-turn-helix domain-containing protein [Paenibacillus sp. MER 99-2]MCM3172360.1 helix-turn-helix domain-containing protein [Paenibacillus sp. MER 99-2]
MNHDQLDAELRKFTDREYFYKQNPTLISQIYESLEQRILENGEKAYIFPDSLPEKDNISISKHIRYAEVPLHVHSYIELNFVYSGQCSQIINGNRVTLKQGQICILDTEMPHSILSTTEDDIIINVLIRKPYFNSSFLSKLANNGILLQFLTSAISDRHNHHRYIIFHSENNVNIPILFKQLLCEFYDKSLGSAEIIDSYMLLIFYELLRVFQYDTNQMTDLKGSTLDMISILNYIEKHYMECTLASTAEHFNFNSKYLSTLIKRTTGFSFKELVLSEKLKYASFLLAHTERPIYDIASLTGQNNLSYFYKKFQERFGQTPQQYRDQHTILQSHLE